jgi:nucleoside-diphosphate-sugar epimerase
VSSACRCALEAKRLANCSYNISGHETLSYREMVGRVFDTLEKRRRFVRVPLWAFRGALGCARLLPRYRHLNLAMAQRMNEDMIFDNSSAARDFGFSPREFRPHIADISTV